MSFEAHDYSVGNILNKSVFLIPRNQRRYVWKKTNWQELFEDILNSIHTGFKPHFIGSVVLKDDGTQDGLSYYTIIDGQQRITTITIALLATMKLFSELEMRDEFQGTIDYIQSKNNRNQTKPVLTSEYHQSLTILINETLGLLETEKIPISNFVDSHIISKTKDKQIGEALKYFYFDIKKDIEQYSQPGERLLAIRNAIVNMVLVRIVSSSEEDSYTIFEILNARGQELEDSELLKNYIMRYVVPEDKRDIAKSYWDEMETVLGTSIHRFIKHYTTHKYGKGESSRESSYRIIQRNTKGQNINALLDDIKLKSEYYAKMVAPNKDPQNGNCSIVEYKVFSFFKNKRQEQFRPVILSLLHQKELGKLSPELYEQSLQYIYSFFVCYNIIGEERSNKLEDIVYKYAKMLENEYSKPLLLEFARSLKSRIPSYDWFLNAFRNLGWSNHHKMYLSDKNKQQVKIVLELVEQYVSQRQDIDAFTIEHVLPDCQSELHAQIGNLIPLEDRLNDRCKDKVLADKCLIYQGSIFCSARGFAERYADKEFIPEKRSEFLAKLIYNNILELDQFDFSED